MDNSIYLDNDEPRSAMEPHSQSMDSLLIKSIFCRLGSINEISKIFLLYKEYDKYLRSEIKGIDPQRKNLILNMSVCYFAITSAVRNARVGWRIKVILKNYASMTFFELLD
jgi:hypothetical protein